MEEFRIGCLYQTEEELVVTKELRQNIFRFESYDAGYGGIS